MRPMVLAPTIALCLILSPAARPAPTVQTPATTALAASEPDTRTALDGMGLTATQAQALEHSLTQTPDNFTTRVQLAGYYSSQRFHSDTAKAAYAAQVLWIIVHRPEARIAGTGMLELIRGIDTDAYPQARALWSSAVQAHPDDTRILGNAAAFLLLSERPVAAKLLAQGQKLEPNNPAWPSKLGEVHALNMHGLTGPAHAAEAQTALAFYEAAYALQDGISKDAALPDLAKIAYEAGAYDKAQTYASLLLSGATDPKSWNYGNRVHSGSLVLGRLALRSGDIAAANKYLLASGKTPGSPQLDSFGPNMTLAQELLARGQKDTVLAYFAECKTFWSMGGDKLRDWTAEVQSGVTPKFGANLDY